MLTPALCATLLKREERHDLPNWAAKLHGYGDKFNDWFGRMSDRYRDRVAKTIEGPRWPLIGYGAMLVLLVLIFWRLPTSFLPVEDQGRAQLQYTLPPGATQPRTLAAADAIQKYFSTKMSDVVDGVYTVAGQGQAGSGQNAGRGFVILKDWGERKGQKNSVDALTKRATGAIGRELRDVEFYALSPPAVRGSRSVQRLYDGIAQQRRIEPRAVQGRA